jgi:hypothetical protein
MSNILIQTPVRELRAKNPYPRAPAATTLILSYYDLGDICQSKNIDTPQ